MSRSVLFCGAVLINAQQSQKRFARAMALHDAIASGHGALFNAARAIRTGGYDRVRYPPRLGELAHVKRFLSHVSRRPVVVLCSDQEKRPMHRVVQTSVVAAALLAVTASSASAQSQSSADHRQDDPVQQQLRQMQEELNLLRR